MEKTYSVLHPAAKKAIVLAGLFAILQPAFGLEINNNTGSTVTASISNCPLSNKVDISPHQSYGAEGDPSATCNYSIVAEGGKKKCSGKINAASGLQVDDGQKQLNCASY